VVLFRLTLVLLFPSTKMLRDHNLVRVLSACGKRAIFAMFRRRMRAERCSLETMGNATTICTDKTGTLTCNKMTVMKVNFGGVFYDAKDKDSFKQKIVQENLDLIFEGICVNSSAFEETREEDSSVEFVGSQTEVALLQLAKDCGIHYKSVRKNLPIANRIPFSSEKKRMSTVIHLQNTDKLRLHCKGASEMLLERCSSYKDDMGHVKDLTDTGRELFTAAIQNFANEAFRTIILAYKDLDSADSQESDHLDTNMVLLAIMAIEDPVRPGVVEGMYGDLSC
jgi:Ca2+-transporting ATPase